MVDRDAHRADSEDSCAFLDWDPALIRSKSKATPTPPVDRPTTHVPVKPPGEWTTNELVAYIRRQYRLGQQRQDQLDRERLRQRRGSREREQSS